MARNTDFQIIYETETFQPLRMQDQTLNPEAKTSSAKFSSASFRSKEIRRLLVDTQDHTFFLGDLNYRVHENVETQEVFDRVTNGDWASLRDDDQLNIERLNENAFQGFEEGQLVFPPTYKFQPGTDEYECRPGKKIRAPAWCDRVLWKSAREGSSRLVTYRSAKVNVSDHKPVSAYFHCDVRLLQDEKLKALYQELLRSMDKLINASTPTLRVDNRMMDFGVVTSGKKSKHSMKVANTGTVMAEWLFVPKNNEEAICKSWLKLKPLSGILAPEEVCDIEVTVDFNDREACKWFADTNGHVSRLIHRFAHERFTDDLSRMFC